MLKDFNKIRGKVVVLSKFSQKKTKQTWIFQYIYSVLELKVLLIIVFQVFLMNKIDYRQKFESRKPIVKNSDYIYLNLVRDDLLYLKYLRTFENLLYFLKYHKLP